MGLWKDLDRLGRRVVAIGSAAAIGLSAVAGDLHSEKVEAKLPQTEQVKKEEAPRRSVEDLERAVREPVWINGKPQSERIQELKRIRDAEGNKAVLDTVYSTNTEKIELREKLPDGSYRFMTVKSKDGQRTEVWHPNGVLASRTNLLTGESIGYHSNGQKSFEQKSFEDLRYEYYPNGQLKMTPHRSATDAYDIFDESGKRVLHRHAVGKNGILNVDLFDEKKGEDIVASYTLSDYNTRATNYTDYYAYAENNAEIAHAASKGEKLSGLTEEGKLTKVSILNDRGTMERYTFKDPPTYMDSEGGGLELDLETLKQDIQEDRQSVQQNNNMAILTQAKKIDQSR